MATASDVHYIPEGCNGMNGLGIPMFNVANVELPRTVPGFAEFLPRQKWSDNGQVQESILGIPERAGWEFLDEASHAWWENRFRTLPESPADVPALLRPGWNIPFDVNSTEPSLTAGAAAASPDDSTTSDDSDDSDQDQDDPTNTVGDSTKRTRPLSVLPAFEQAKMLKTCCQQTRFQPPSVNKPTRLFQLYCIQELTLRYNTMGPCAGAW